MNWDAIGALGEVLGGLAVIGSLIYVGIQIRHSARVAQGDTEKDLAIHWSDIMSTLSNNSQFAEVFLNGMRNLDELSAVERTQFGSFCNQIMSHHSTTFRMYENGLLGKDLLEGGDRTVLGLLQSKAGRLWWEEYGANYDKSHREHVTQLLKNNTVPSWEQSKFFSGDT